MARVMAEVTPKRCRDTWVRFILMLVDAKRQSRVSWNEALPGDIHTLPLESVAGAVSRTVLMCILWKVDINVMQNSKSSQNDVKWEVLSLLPRSPHWQMLHFLSVPTCVQDRRHVLKTKYFAIFEHKQSQVGMFSTLWFFNYKSDFLSMF